MPLATLLMGAALAATPASPTCSTGTVPIGGIPLYVDRQGSGPLTVLFESGNGNDSHVWDQIEPQVRALGVVTLRYDRRGYGESAPRREQTYRVEQDLAVVKELLDRCSGRGPVLYVAHSYGGVLGLLTSRTDRRIKGLVLVDTVAPGVETVAMAKAQRAELRPQYAEVRQQAPALAQAIIPVVEALPETTAIINAARISTALPITDIVANGGNDDAPDRAETWRQGHRRFVAAATGMRELIDARDSSHKVMADKPALVLAAIGEMVRRLTGR